ncbi:hypothetical protein HO173_007660 [Letharia columbiana]|uniref:Uncharacterized protein n=1 Tax=Letharia columbiana TaxID=112416 RepID=A0A8H6L3M0_9LECA|nr:uncharacterized protein HO173_007660 [Letharia columbiana]KAF6234240.1 hypothetical protein HO173_007660 [Letharia columbiana]
MVPRGKCRWTAAITAKSWPTNVSPSVYISYTNLFATVNCVLTDAVRTGGTYSTLIAYPPEALSTQACTPGTESDDPFVFESGFKARTRLHSPRQSKRLDQSFCSLLPFLPPGLSLIDPAWKSCKNFQPGVFDPPRTLNKATALVGLGLGGSQTSTAAPGAKPTPSQVSATPTPTANNGGNNAAEPPVPPPGSPESDPPIAGPTKGNPPNLADPPAIPVLNSAAVSSIIQNLPLGGNNPEAPSSPDDPHNSEGNGEGDPQGAVGNNDSDPPLPSIGNDQIQKADGGGIVIGSTTLRPGDQVTKDGTPISVGSDRVVIGDSTIPLAAPTGDFSDPNTIVMAAPDPIIVGGNTVHGLPAGGVLIAGSTYSPGAHTMISGIAVSVAADNVVVDGVTYTLPSQNSPTPVLLGGQTITKAWNGGVIIGSSTYLPGTQAKVFGTALSVGADNVVVDGSTYTLPTSPTGKPILIDGKSITRASNGGAVIDDTTIAPGSQAIVLGHTISAGSSSVVIDGSTYALPTNTVPENAVAQLLTLANGVVISAGGSAAAVSGITYSIPLDNGELIVNGKTMAFPTEVESVFTIAGQTFTANPTGFVVDGYSVSRDGSAITLLGTIVSLGPSGLQIGSSTIPLTFPQETAGLQSVFTIAGQTFTANPTGFAVDGHSVSMDGSAVTLSGTVVSLGSEGLQIGSTTWPLTPAQETADVGLGGLIMSGFGNGAGAATNVSSPMPFTGGSPRLRAGAWSTILVVFGMSAGMVAYAL